MGTYEILSLIPAPLVAVILFVLLWNKSDHSKLKLYYKSLLAGMAGVILVYLVDRFIIYMNLHSLHSLNRTLFYAFVLTGGVFEFWKFIVLRILVYPSGKAPKSLNSIFYSLVIASGFTITYSIYAVYFAPPYISDSLYAITIAPVFVSIAIIMGYFSCSTSTRNYPGVDLLTGFFLAVVFQGIYRFCLLTTDLPLIYMAVGAMVITGITLLVISFREASDSN